MARGRRKQEPTGIKGVIAKATDAIPGVKGSGKRSKSSSKNPISGIVDALPIGGGSKSKKSSSSPLGQARRRRGPGGRRRRTGHQEPRQDHLEAQARGRRSGDRGR
jgi:hypothetical protein